MVSNNLNINYQEIIELINDHFTVIKEENMEDYGDINFEVADEQDFAKKPRNKFENKLYICIKFGEAEVNFNEAEVDVDLIIAGLENEIGLVQRFLMDFVTKFNLSVDNEMTQTYSSPTISSNFARIYSDFRSIFRISSVFVIGSNLLRLEELTYWYEEEVYNEDTQQTETVLKSEEIQILVYNDGTENSLNPQPYPGEYGRVKSYGTFQTFTFCITTIPDGSKRLIQDIWKMRFDKTKSHQNDTFIFSGKYSEIDGVDLGFDKWEFKCKSVEYVSRIAENPGINLTFSL